MNSDLGENLEGLHREYLRSDPQSAQECVSQKNASLLNSVQGENLKDRKYALHDQELECQRSAPFVAATRNRIRSSALPPAVLPAAGHANRAHGDVLGRDLGHFDDLLGIRHERVEETEDVWQLFHRLRHRSVENLHRMRAADEVDDVLHGVPLDPLLRPRPGENPGAATRRQAHLRRPEKSTQCLPPGEWVLPELGRVFRLVPTPRPCPSSALVRHGACTRTGPQ